MSEEQKTKTASILSQIMAEREKAETAELKKEMTVLFNDYIKAKKVVEGIEAKMIELAEKAGDKNLDIRSIFGD